VALSCRKRFRSPCPRRGNDLVAMCKGMPLLWAIAVIEAA